MRSLAEADQYDTIHGKTYQDALGEDGQKAVREFARQGIERPKRSSSPSAPK